MMFPKSTIWNILLLPILVIVDPLDLFLVQVKGFSLKHFTSFTSPKITNRKVHDYLQSSATSTTSSPSTTFLAAETNDNADDGTTSPHPQAIGTGYSQSLDLYTAIQEATKIALNALPSPLPQGKIDLGKIYITSIYDSQFSPSQVVPAVLANIQHHYTDMHSEEGREKSVLQKLVGCYTGGNVGSQLNNSGDESSTVCKPMESEGEPSVVVTLCVLPDTEIKTFHVLADDVPDELGRMDFNKWKNSIGLKNLNNSGDGNDQSMVKDAPSFMYLPSPSFQTDLDDFLAAMKICFGPDQTSFGALASTVSSLSRARLFRYDVDDPGCLQTLADGCVGVAMTGDVQFNVMVAQGAKPVGGVYRVVAGTDSTINAIQLDELATEQLEGEESDFGDDEDEEDNGDDDEADAKKKFNAAAYAKAIIPKPILAEANYVMKSLSDDDQAFMRSSLLVGIERNGNVAQTPNQLMNLAEGKGHSFTVLQVASAGMKDGSVTLPLGSVDVKPGARLRFFVRDRGFAKREIEALWIGQKKRMLEKSLSDDGEESKSTKNTFNPSGCFFYPTLDRGTKFFGDSSYESNAISKYSPSLPSISGFFCNGAIAALDENDNNAMIHGSASSFVLVGSKSNRPIYSHTEAQTQDEVADEEIKEVVEDEVPSEVVNNKDQPAPRSEDGELIVRRREIHSGRALTVSNVEWSVVENTASPTSALEGFMWEKETEVDRQRERVPLSNLVSQCKLSDMDPLKPKPRDWAGAFKRAAKENGFVVIPELKRLEPKSGSLRKRYDLTKLAKQIVKAKSPALSINCDGVLFGGSMEDATTIRENISSSLLDSPDAEDGVVPIPILASDLVLYPYQLYKFRLAGTDAVNIIVGALTSKDLLYVTKIAATLKLQIVASVTSEVQLNSVNQLSGGIHALVVSNRDLETYGFDESGEQALSLLRSEAMGKFKEKFGSDIPILVDGRVGIIKCSDGNGGESTKAYIEALKEAGAVGAIVGSGLVTDSKGEIVEAIESLQSV